jgi:hypothetical protein
MYNDVVLTSTIYGGSRGGWHHCIEDAIIADTITQYSVNVVTSAYLLNATTYETEAHISHMMKRLELQHRLAYIMDSRHIFRKIRHNHRKKLSTVCRHEHRKNTLHIKFYGF